MSHSQLWGAEKLSLNGGWVRWRGYKVLKTIQENKMLNSEVKWYKLFVNLLCDI